MAIAYYGVTIPEKVNWVETPEGYLIFKNAVIGRTGFQTYKGYELDKQELDEQGIQVKDDDDVNLYRDPEEVFSPKTIASFVGKSLTDGHPSELLSLENVKDHEQGQVMNVRPGPEPLESGDLPLLADLIVKSRYLIEKIKAGLRELSCGYNYHVLKDGDLIKQVDIVGNHVAVVEQARAGREAVIVDSAITSIERKFIMSTWLDRIINSNSKPRLVAWAKDAKPEEIADAIAQLGSELEARPVAVAAAVIEKPKPAAKDEAGEREKYHKTLDRFLDSKDEEREAEDEEMKALADMFKKHGSADAAVDEEEEKKEEKKEEGEDEEEEEGSDEAADEGGALTIEPSDRPKTLGPGTDSIRAARIEGARAVLKVLKPMVAQSGNKKLIKAFDTAARTVQSKSHGNTSGGYGTVVEAASRRGKDAQDSVDQVNGKKQLEKIAEVEKMYAERFNVVKR
jgi:hypothetical protein